MLECTYSLFNAFLNKQEMKKDFHCLKIVWIFQTYSNYTTLLKRYTLLE